jgi:hypothetical protein
MFELLSQTWWEPGSKDVFDVGDMAIIFGFLLTVLGAATGFSRWWLKQLRKTIHEEVEEYTKPIQPHANGGLSLPDVARKVEKLENTVENVKIDLKEDTVRLEKSIIDLRKENKDTWGMLIQHLIKNEDK